MSGESREILQRKYSARVSVSQAHNKLSILKKIKKNNENIMSVTGSEQAFKKLNQRTVSRLIGFLNSSDPWNKECMDLSSACGWDLQLRNWTSEISRDPQNKTCVQGRIQTSVTSSGPFCPT